MDFSDSRSRIDIFQVHLGAVALWNVIRSRAFRIHFVPALVGDVQVLHLRMLCEAERASAALVGLWFLLLLLFSSLLLA